MSKLLMTIWTGTIKNWKSVEILFLILEFKASIGVAFMIAKHHK